MTVQRNELRLLTLAAAATAAVLASTGDVLGQAQLARPTAIPAAAETNWIPIRVPGAWETLDTLAAYDGFAWYRCFVRIPKSWEGGRLLLSAEEIDDVDEGFFNGEKVGANGSMPPLYGPPSSTVRRPYVIDPDLVRFGEENLITFRVYDREGRGGIVRGPVQLVFGDEAIDLSGQWQFRVGDQSSWAHRQATPGGPEAAAELAEYLQALGSEPAGFKGITPMDKEARRRAVEEVRRTVQDMQSPNARIDGKGAPRDPDRALASFTVSEGLSLDLVLSEPVVRQPIHSEFDERGRLWVTQYIQYPDPAGLEVVAWDTHLRRVFNAVPPPPPYRRPEHQKFIGRDKITIHEDADGDGIFETHKTFLDGLNIVTATLQGSGGVWVMNPPYLLFYPDADHDDVPDADPVVHLSGFGLEDTHSVANSIKWGPDGWIYGATGSTVTARIKAELNPARTPLRFFGQAIWRYHPRTHEFELFAEGGWNTFGLDFDDEGRIYSGTNGDEQAVDFVQGGFYQKGFGKHGPHTNPYAFGHFFGIPHQGHKIRLVHQWVIYGGGALPGYEGLMIGGNSLANWIVAARKEKDGSSFHTYETHRPVTTDDKWFRPVHADFGPDGGIYIADWYDARITHLDPRDNWDHERGRIYRLRSNHAARLPPIDLSKSTSAELVTLLDHKNRWFRRTALRLLAQRQDKSVIPRLRSLLSQSKGQLALESLWAIHLLEGLDEPLTLEALAHPNPHVRLWTARLLGDPKRELAARVLERLETLARTDDQPEVISQLAATAQRLLPIQALPLLRQLIARTEFAADRHIPMQLWWALEAKLTQDIETVARWLEDKETWQLPLFQDILCSRIARRLATERSEATLVQCARLLKLAPNREAVNRFLQGMEEGFRGTSVSRIPPELQRVLDVLWSDQKPEGPLIGFAMRLGDAGATRQARDFIRDPSRPAQDRIELIQKLAEVRDAPSEQLFLTLVEGQPDGSTESVRLAALNSLRRYSNDAIATRILAAYPVLDGPLRKTAESLLSGRLDWSRRLLDAVDSGQIPRSNIGFDNLLLIQNRNDAATTALIKKIWGELRKPEAEKMQRIEAIRKLLGGPAPAGDKAAGKDLFVQVCGACHKLHGIGRDVGPDLTGYERDNLEYLLTAVVDPSLAVREEFEMVSLTLKPAAGETEGAILSGFVVEAGEQALSFRDLAGNLTVIANADIAAREHSRTSIMPDGLLDPLTPEQIRDLFAFLQSGAN